MVLLVGDRVDLQDLHISCIMEILRLDFKESLTNLQQQQRCQFNNTIATAVEQQ